MLTKPKYSLKDMALWTRKETLLFFCFSALITFAYHKLKFEFLEVPWTPIALVGTAVAFIVGFRNNSAYERIWEARKIWGGIVNDSRAWANWCWTMVNNDENSKPVAEEQLKLEKTKLIHRHLAWLTALRYSQRQRKPWELFSSEMTNREWSDLTCTPEKCETLDQALAPYTTAEEREEYHSVANIPSKILFKQSQELQRLKEDDLLWEFNYLELQGIIRSLLALQGKSERIKNFPYPRQYATLSDNFIKIFLFLLPFGIIPEFSEMAGKLSQQFAWGEHFVWLAVPFCTVVSWVFNTMERIGRVGENPFEGSPNDVPISTISRSIEINLLQLIKSDQIPEPFPALKDVQM